MSDQSTNRDYGARNSVVEHGEEDSALLGEGRRVSRGRENNTFASTLSNFQMVIVLTPLKLLVSFLVLVLALAAAYVVFKPKHTAQEERIGRLPYMGWNSWNAYWCDVSEQKVLDAADLMVKLGLKDAGYKYVNIDDCYSEKKRNSNGDIVVDKQKFPSGFNTLTDKIHDLGFKAGIYSDSGWYTCAMYPGSYQNEERDIKQFQDWGFDLLKYDNCAVPFDNITRENIIGRYTRMSNAIKDLSLTSGKPPILLSLCEWGREEPWLWARTIGQAWRTTNDIESNWPSIAKLINQNSFISWASDFYGHNDMDMLEVGNGELNYEESKTHFTAWALLKSPLLIGTHLATIKDDALEILKNREIIAINQDSVVGTGVTPFRWGINPDRVSNFTHPAQYWSGNSENGTVFMLINTLNEPADMSFNLTESPWIRAGRQYTVRDLWTHTDNGTAVRNFTAYAVPPHGVVALLLKDAGDEPEGTMPFCAREEWCIHKNGTRYGHEGWHGD